MWGLEVIPAIIYHCNALPVVTLQGQDHKVKNYGTMWMVLSQEIHHVQYESSISSGLKVMAKVKVTIHAHTITRTPTLGLWHQLPGHSSWLAKIMGIFVCFLTGLKNTNLVEDVVILLPVKFHWILLGSFRGKINKTCVCETGMPPAARSQNMAKSLSPTFWPCSRGMWCQWSVRNP